MIMQYHNVLTPVNFPINPLQNIDYVLNLFDLESTNDQVLHLDDSILKLEVKNLITNSDLIIEKINVWRWSIDRQKLEPPHTDGNYRGSKRLVGLNWVLDDNNTGVEFYDVDHGTPQFKKETDKKHYTNWQFPIGTIPLVVWNNKVPSLINPQSPHHIIGPNGTFRHSMTIKFLGNPSYDFVLEKLGKFVL